MSKQNVLQNVILACDEMISSNKFLLEVDANERSITHQLAVYLRDHFPDFDIDCEYNRAGVDIKRLEDYKTTIYSDDTNATTVFPDVIIHKRGNQDNNFVVIEAKKAGLSFKSDEKKLGLYKTQLGYENAFLIIFHTGSQSLESSRFEVREIA